MKNRSCRIRRQPRCYPKSSDSENFLYFCRHITGVDYRLMADRGCADIRDRVRLLCPGDLRQDINELKLKLGKKEDKDR